MDFLEQCNRLEVEIESFASSLEIADPAAVVPTCPDWNIADLARHLGTVHRWAEYLVSHESPRRVSPRVLGLEESVPADPTWIREGGEQLVSTLRRSDPLAPMWAWGTDQRVAFWSRRQLHETLIHRFDLEFAAGVPSRIDADTAADAIDEFLANLAPSTAFSPSVANLRGQGETLVFEATDVTRSWSTVLNPDAFEIRDGSGEADVTLKGPAAALALVIYGRIAPEDPTLGISGDGALVRFWLANSALQ